ncbi:hypothetical protein GCM10022626_19730 [[Pseudomonas] carboxydohydrogena]
MLHRLAVIGLTGVILRRLIVEFILTLRLRIVVDKANLIVQDKKTYALTEFLRDALR